MDLASELGLAINANDGRCPVIESALTKAFDFVLAKTPQDAKPGLTVRSVFGQCQIEITDGVDVVSLSIAPKGVQALIDELSTAIGESDDSDELKANLIRMRQYVMRKSLGIGECVAWCKIKERFGIGIRDADDDQWLQDYESLESA